MKADTSMLQTELGIQKEDLFQVIYLNFIKLFLKK